MSRKFELTIITYFNKFHIKFIMCHVSYKFLSMTLCLTSKVSLNSQNLFYLCIKQLINKL